MTPIEERAANESVNHRWRNEMKRSRFGCLLVSEGYPGLPGSFGLWFGRSMWVLRRWRKKASVTKLQCNYD